MHGATYNHNRIVDLNTITSTTKDATGTGTAGAHGLDATTPTAPENSAVITGVHNTMEKGYTAGHSTAEGYAWWQEQVALQRAGYGVAGVRGEVKVCGTVPVLRGQVGLSVTGGLRVSGMWRCGSRWCPECRAKVAKHKAAEVAVAVDYALDNDLIVVMYTLTASHVTTETLEAAGGSLHEAVQGVTTKQVRTEQGRAYALATKGRRSADLRRGRVGLITAQEATTDDLMVPGSRTGVHWHRHMLVFLEPRAGMTPAEVADDYGTMLFGYWQAGCESVGLVADRKGFDLTVATGRESARELAGYVAKGEAMNAAEDPTRIHLEMTHAEGKKGRGKSRVSPEQVLRNIAYLGEVEPKGKRVRRLVAQWRDMEEGTKGVHWLRWSPGLRDLVGLADELTDEEIANTEDMAAEEPVAVVSWDELREHVEELRRVVREAETTDGTGWATLLLCLDSLGVDYTLTTAEEWGQRLSARWTAVRKGSDQSV